MDITTAQQETETTRVKAENAQHAATPYVRLCDLSDAMWHAERAIRATVQEARDAGETWASIAVALGVTKQAAQQKYGTDRR